MEQYKYACDGGCLAIRTESGTSYYHNGYGDAEHDVFVITDAEQFSDRRFCLVSHFDIFEGKTAEILNYDCDETQWMKVHALCTLDAGRWFVYSDEGTMYLVKES
jgi:hypothetical protein